MGTKDTTRYVGTITESMPNTMFRMELEDGRIILATLKGSLRRRYVRIFPGDKVVVEMTKYDTERGRIVQKIGR
ncbi:MAG: Translation initiation factor IF-1 [Candidatus Woesebacteria bacterium GW2011_GWA1_37_7]|uniref:Translation initiation factor IF-1 n=2 Tax=Candidatus Woeseibacteriota TaxID=1752722 RepID=A0A0G0H5H8_9BACT|nr:MAG: Translation initiation factor IF-1 [Candidatus Woesebacteria bacterium GW2011_GWA1_37_7]OGM18411.1 MAG: translation initiation factor IF-1 [Candidatus Woesebacteria bacterium RIFCSPHIGHO2_01_FULL_37_10]